MVVPFKPPRTSGNILHPFFHTVKLEVWQAWDQGHVCHDVLVLLIQTSIELKQFQELTIVNKSVSESKNYLKAKTLT